VKLDLEGHVVAITGAASGIGRASAHAFAAEGARLVLLDRDTEGLDRLRDELVAGSGEVLTAACDVIDEHAVGAAIDSGARAFGGISHLIVSAGVSGPFGRDLGATSLAEWQQVFAVNVTGAFLAVRAVLPWLRAASEATVVFIASDSAMVAAPGMVPYCASKGALVQFGKALAVDLAPDRVRVNSVCPSIVDTPMSRSDLGLADDGFADVDFPVQTPHDVAQHVVYLSSARSSPINGVALLSDFGYAARSSFPA
jgi:NAD(P)-dependent dehydrogenase (short-subunit alcohol dehydrogenase family)